MKGKKSTSEFLNDLKEKSYIDSSIHSQVIDFWEIFKNQNNFDLDSEVVIGVSPDSVFHLSWRVEGLYFEVEFLQDQKIEGFYETSDGEVDSLKFSGVEEAFQWTQNILESNYKSSE